MLKVQVPDSVRQEATAALAGDSNLADWFIKRLEQKAASELAEALADQALVSVDNYKAAHRPVDGLGQCTFRIAQSLANWITKWVSADHVYDEAFVTQLIKDNGHLCLKPTYQQKAQIIRPDWTPEKPDAVIVAA
jgi:hypothetical protein